MSLLSTKRLRLRLGDILYSVSRQLFHIFYRLTDSVGFMTRMLFIAAVRDGLTVNKIKGRDEESLE